MPIKKCQKDGKSGWKFGDSGTCYIGPSGKAKAQKQAKAMFANGYKGKFNEIYESTMKTLQNESEDSNVDEFISKCNSLKEKKAEDFIQPVEDIQLVDDSDFTV